MTPEQHEQLDDALDGRLAMMPPEMQALVTLAEDVRRSLADWRLSEAQRDLIRRRVADLVQERRTWSWRRLSASRRTRALLGGSAVTVAAVAAIGVAIARGRRHSHALAT